MITITLATLLSTSAHAATDAQLAFAQQIQDMSAAAKQVQSAEYTFHQQEWVNGQGPSYEIQVKFRSPGDVYMKWTGKHNQGREVLYSPTRWNGNLKVNPGRFLPVLTLDPKGKLANQGQRHSIDTLGFEATVAYFVADMNRLRDDPTRAPVEDQGVQTVYGEPARCFEADLPRSQDKRFYADRVQLCTHVRTNLPARILAWEWMDGDLVLVEDYGYENLVLNTGLQDADFDLDNPAYGF